MCWGGRGAETADLLLLDDKRVKPKDLLINIPPTMSAGYTPPPNAAATPPVAPQFRAPPPPMDDAAQHEVMEHAHTIVEVAACSIKSAMTALKRCKGNLEAALEEILSKNGFTVLVISFCPAQESYFTEVFRSLRMKPFFSDDQVEELLLQKPITPYFVRYDEYLPFARSRDWEAFFRDIIVDGEFPLIPADPKDRVSCTGGLVGAVTATDGACPLVDFINEKLLGDCNAGPSLGNPFCSSEVRQCKGAMHSALEKAGLAYIRSTKVRCANDALDFANDVLSSGSKLIVKPATGAGSEFVTLCSSIDELHVAFRVAEGLETTQNTTTDWMVVQEYIDGDEYVVDTVSCHSQHVTTDVWLSKKDPHNSVSNRIRSAVEKELASSGIVRPSLPTTSLLYDRLDFVKSVADLPHDSVVRRVIDYTMAAMDALGFVNGCAHCEVRVRTDQRTGAVEPVLIELNPRMQGDTPRSTTLVGYDQYILLAYLCVTITSKILSPEENHPWKFPEATFPKLYRSVADKTRCVLFLRVEEDGYLSEPGRRYLTKLPTFVAFTRSMISDPVQPGYIGRARKTTDLYSCPAAIIFEGHGPDIEKDIAVVRQMENGRVGASGCQRILKHVAMIVQRFTAMTKRRELVAARQQTDLRESDGSFMEGAGDAPPSPQEVYSMLELPDEELAALLPILGPSTIDLMMRYAENLVQTSRARASNAIRDAKAALVALDPPPLFISNEEWADVVASHCGSVLGS